ncbi:hypothetical protein KI387_011095, partial [Taxus chinensis]
MKQKGGDKLIAGSSEPKSKRSRKSLPREKSSTTTNAGNRSSIYRGVTKYVITLPYLYPQKLAAAFVFSFPGKSLMIDNYSFQNFRHRWTGRYEAHLWDKSCWNETKNKKGRQVYLGAYEDEETAAHAYDLAALKYWGSETTLNFASTTYTKELQDMQNISKEEYLASLRRRSSGFSRGVSKYRGVARHHQNGRWEARIGRVFGNKYLYLGTY